MTNTRRLPFTGTEQYLPITGIVPVTQVITAIEQKQNKTTTKNNSVQYR